MAPTRRRPLPSLPRTLVGVLPFLLLLVLLGACGAGPEVDVSTAVVQAVETEAPAAAAPTDTPLPEPTAAAEPTPAEPVAIQFWTADNQGDRIAAYRTVADRYMSANPGVEITIVPVEESTLSQRLREAALGDVLPDIARLGLERIPPLMADGLVDEAAADATIDAIGRDDFRDGPLAMVTNPETGLASAVPYDGWIQALWYRRDLFEETGLESPVTWEQINVACDVIGGNESIPYALTLPTDPQQNYVHQIFEQVAMSNNAWPFDEAGNVTMNSPEMIAALRFYTNLQRCAPTGIQNLYDARENYEQGDAPMLFYSTYIMDDLVEGSELRDGSGSVAVALEDLAQRSAFASGMVGPGGAASYGQLTALALLEGAHPVAQDVVRFFLTDGYADVIATAPLGKIPVLESAAQEWTTLSPVFENYSPATLGHIASGFDTMQRWLFRPGYTNRERAIIGEIRGRPAYSAGYPQHCRR